MATLAPDKARPVIVYCHHVEWWRSYNVALRLIHLGYRDVRWLREGIGRWLNQSLPYSVLSAPPST